MVVEFESEMLRNKLCGAAGPQGFYPALSRSITNRISELRAAKSLGDIPTAPPPKLRLLSEAENKCAVALDEKHSLVLRAIHEPCDDRFNCSTTSITSVCVLSISEN